MSYSDIDIRLDGAVRIIQLNRPKVRNALRSQTLKEIAAVLDEDAGNTAVRATVISGNEQVFAAGADVKGLQSMSADSPEFIARHQSWKTIRHYPKPLIAAVNGYALGGGCELMLHCDTVIAGDNVQIGLPEVRLGLIPGAGGTQRLVRSIGKAKAMQMILGGVNLDAEQALAFGVIAERVPREATFRRACELAATMAKQSPPAVMAAKKAVLTAYEMPLEQGLAAEKAAFAALLGSHNTQEGIAAFLEKRRPAYEYDE